jgi:hypothetical protein
MPTKTSTPKETAPDAETPPAGAAAGTATTTAPATPAELARIAETLGLPPGTPTEDILATIEALRQGGGAADPEFERLVAAKVKAGMDREDAVVLVRKQLAHNKKMAPVWKAEAERKQRQRQAREAALARL